MYFIAFPNKQRYIQPLKSIESNHTFHQKAKIIMNNCYNTNANSTNTYFRKLKLIISSKKNEELISDKIYKVKCDFINRKSFQVKNSVISPQESRNNNSLNYYNRYYSITNANTQSIINTSKINKTYNELLKLSSNSSTKSHSYSQNRIKTSLKPTIAKLNSDRLSFNKILSLSNNTPSKQKCSFLN